MKLLFDQNVSPRLCQALQDLYPGSMHVQDVGLAGASDLEVWQFAAANGFSITTKDGDFHQRSFLVGHPPKVIWIRLGNCSTTDIERLLRSRVEEIRRFDADDDASFLALGREDS